MESRPIKKGLTALDAALTMLVVLLIVQMWLLTATLESYLAGHHDVVMPGLAVSALLMAVCVALYTFVRRIDHEVRRARRRSSLG
jgi:predicted Co/Zn/Cd cation transporter (cation efflux family)